MEIQVWTVYDCMQIDAKKKYPNAQNNAKFV